jgi:arylformamidase
MNETTAGLAQEGSASSSPYELVDLSRPLTVETVDALMGDLVTEGRNPYFRDITLEVAVDHTQSNAHSCFLRIPDHVATHMDAPIHAVAGGGFLESVEIHKLIGSAVVFDVSGHGLDHGFTADELAIADPGLRPGDIALLYSGFQDAVPGERMQQTFLTQGAAQWLVDQGANAVGMEPASPDPIWAGMYEYGWLEKDGANLPAWPAHTTLLSNDVYIIEGLTNLDQIKGERVQFAALPPLIPGLSGAPVRAVAWR